LCRVGNRIIEASVSPLCTLCDYQQPLETFCILRLANGNGEEPKNLSILIEASHDYPVMGRSRIKAVKSFHRTSAISLESTLMENQHLPSVPCLLPMRAKKFFSSDDEEAGAFVLLGNHNKK